MRLGLEKLQPLGRNIRIARHISSAALENADDRRNEVQAAFET